MTPPDRPPSTLPAVVLLAALCAAACAHAWFGYKGFAVDHAFVAFRYAERLADGLGLTWTTGPTTEGYDGLLWVLWLAAADVIGLDPIRAARWSGYAGLIASVCAVSLDPERLRPTVGRALTGGLLLVASSSMAAWTLGGLELVPLAGLAAVAAVLARHQVDHGTTRGRMALAALLVAVVLVRADAYPLALGVVIGGALTSGSVRPWVAVALAPVLALLVQTGFRIGTTGTAWPPTIPEDLGVLRTTVGFGWTARASLAHLFLLVGAATALAAEGKRAVLPLVVALSWLCHLVFVGSDAQPGWWLLVPGLPAFALLASEGLGARIDAGSRTLVVAAITLGVGHAAAVQATGGLPDARSAHSEWYAPPLAHVLRGAFSDRAPLLAVEEPGLMPYWTGFEAHDLGSDTPPPRPPDLIVLTDPTGRQPVTGGSRALVLAADFAEFHQRVGLTAKSKLDGRQRLQVWIRREGGVLGVTRSKQEVRVPGWFLASPGSWSARWSQQILAAPVTSDRASVVPDLLLRAGTWEITTDTGPAVIDIRCEGVAATRVAGGTPAVVRLDEPGHVDLVVWAAKDPLAIREVVVRATDAAPSRHCTGEPPVVPWAELPREVAGQAAWDAPGALRLGERGVTVVLAGPVLSPDLGVAVDANDPYEVRFWRGDQPAGRVRVTRVPGSGLVERVVPIPEEALLAGADRFQVIPLEGDGAWSIGAARFLDAP